MEELQDVIVMLFPLKSEEQRKEMMDTLTEGFKPRQDKGLDEPDGRNDDGTLYERVKSARFERARSASLRPKSAKQKPEGTRKKKRVGVSRLNENKPKSKLSRRPEPLGRSESPEYYSDKEYLQNDSYSPRHTSTKSKKKKKAPRRYADDDGYYD